MKRMLAVLGLTFVLSPAVFAAPSAPAEIAPACPAASAGQVPGSGETPLFLSACQISKDCPCGSGFVTISCTGNVSCTAQALSITCDGHRYSCTMVDCNPQGGE
jgi:hypothetical protein